MDGNEIKEATFEDALYCAKALVGVERCEECRFYTLGDVWCDDVYGIMHEALEEVKAYRAIGTVEDLKTMKENGAFTGVELAQILAMQMELKKYQSIGTVEELQEMKSGDFTEHLLNMGYTKGIKDGYNKAIDDVFDFLKTQRDKKYMKVNFDDLEIREYKEQLKGE